MDQRTGQEATIIVELSAEVSSARVAREYTRACLLECLTDVDVERVVLVVSELVTNAVAHGGPHAPRACITLDIDPPPQVVRIAVHEATSRSPIVVAADARSAAGRGMWLVDALASRWGVTPSPAGKIVWCTIEP